MDYVLDAFEKKKGEYSAENLDVLKKLKWN